MSVTTKQWQDAGFPFESWLRYASASKYAQLAVEREFARRYPEHATEEQLKLVRDTDFIASNTAKHGHNGEG